MGVKASKGERESASMPAERMRLPLVLAYALPAMPLAALGLPIFAYLPQWYAENTGLGLAAIGTIFAAAKIWDVVTDPILGVVSDRFESRFGRRRHWMVAGTPIMLVATAFLFLYPPLSGGSAAIGPLFLGGWLIVLYTGWTLLSISHLAWGAELSSDYDQRARILGTRELFFFLGSIAILVLPAVIERSGGSRTEQIESMGVAVLIFLPVAVAVATVLVGEPRQRPSPPITWRAAAGALVGSRALKILLAADFALLVGYTLNGSMFLWLARDVLLLGGWSAGMLFVFIMSGVLLIPLIIRLAYRLGKHVVLALSNTLNVAALPLLLVVPEGNVAYSAVVFVLLSINVAAGPVLSRAIAADVVDDDELRSGHARTGLIFSLVTMTNKIGSATGVWLAFNLLAIIGFTPGADAHDPETLTRFRWIYAGVPAVLSLAVVALMVRFPIDRARQRILRQQIEARRR